MVRITAASAIDAATSATVRYMVPANFARGEIMPKMSDNRRKRIQAKQRKATNALKRTTKAAKRERNKAAG